MRDATVEQCLEALRALPVGGARKLATWNLRWLVTRDSPRAGPKRALISRLLASGHGVAIEETHWDA
eukprot:5150997-Alexandrium_andersonii.AAC.1